MLFTNIKKKTQKLNYKIIKIYIILQYRDNMNRAKNKSFHLTTLTWDKDLCDFELPLDELFKELMLHILDFLEPNELGEDGGVCLNDQLSPEWFVPRVSVITCSLAGGTLNGSVVCFSNASTASCKCVNSDSIATSSSTTGLKKPTNIQNRLRSSTKAARTARFAVSSKIWRRSVTSCNDQSTRRCKSGTCVFVFPVNDFRATFFCNRSVSVERFFSSALARL